MSDEQIVAGTPLNEAAFAQSLGIDPEQVRQGSIAVELRYRTAMVTWDGMMPVTAEQLHDALTAAEVER